MSDPRDRTCAPGIADAVARCAADAAFLTELGRILHQADQAADEQRWTCRACGQCCRFEQFGHKLFVTAGELAFLIRPAAPWQDLRSGTRANPAEMCPYQHGNRCLARDSRTLGCRLFFCDPAATDWFSSVYEDIHDQIKRLHAAHGLPYLYVELTTALAKLASPRP